MHLYCIYISGLLSAALFMYNPRSIFNPSSVVTNCRIPDDHISQRRYPWFVARDIMYHAIEQFIQQAQVFNRLKEQYGDRETVSRNARYTVRSFVAWGVLKDTNTKGCYEKAVPIVITDLDLAVLVYESALLASSEAKSALGLLINNPAFFPFHLPAMTGDFVSQRSKRIDVIRYGLDDELLKLKEG